MAFLRGKIKDGSWLTPDSLLKIFNTCSYGKPIFMHQIMSYAENILFKNVHYLHACRVGNWRFFTPGWFYVSESMDPRRNYNQPSLPDAVYCYCLCYYMAASKNQ